MGSGREGAWRPPEGRSETPEVAAMCALSGLPSFLRRPRQMQGK